MPASGTTGDDVAAYVVAIVRDSYRTLTAGTDRHRAGESGGGSL